MVILGNFAQISWQQHYDNLFLGFEEERKNNVGIFGWELLNFWKFWVNFCIFEEIQWTLKLYGFYEILVNVSKFQYNRNFRRAQALIYFQSSVLQIVFNGNKTCAMIWRLHLMTVARVLSAEATLFMHKKPLAVLYSCIIMLI